MNFMTSVSGAMQHPSQRASLIGAMATLCSLFLFRNNIELDSLVCGIGQRRKVV